MFEIIDGELKSFSADEIRNGTLLIPEGVEVVRLDDYFLEHEVSENSKYENLKKIIFPKTIKKTIGGHFTYFKNLEEIELKEGVKEISQYAFAYTNIKKAIIPNSVKNIGKFAFFNCANLKDITLSQNLEKIGDSAFRFCSSLVNIDLPKNLKIIDAGAFCGCNLKKLTELPSGLIELGDSAFMNTKISKIKIPSSVKEINSSTFELSKVKRIELDKKEMLSNKNFAMFVKNGDIQFDVFEEDNKYYAVYGNLRIRKMKRQKYKQAKILQKDELNAEYPNNTYFLMGNSDDIYNKLKNITTKQHIYPELIFKLQEDIANGEEVDMHFYKLLEKLNIPLALKENVDKLAYNLGIFKKPFKEIIVNKDGKERVQTIEYAHKAYEFFKQINYSMARNYFSGIEYLQFKPEFARFITDKNNIKEILDQEDISGCFIGKCFNQYEKVQETNKSHKGSQRQLKPTVNKFINYFAENKFKNVKEEERDLASFIGKYYDEQEVFEVSKRLLQIQKSKNIANNILNKSIIEERMDNIERLKQSITSGAQNVLKNLNAISEKNFTYEFLDKHDWLNMVLGKYCDCCAHLKGFGGGIAIASMIDPNVQNLVIRNSVGRVISKATLYVNREQGYGVFNTIELKQTITNDLQKQYIYNKYIKAINEFVKEYNIENPTNKIKQINVGISNNDLKEIILKNNKISKVNLEAIDYSKYSMLKNFYEGDWQEEQYVLYKDDQQKDKEKLNV